LQLRWLSQPVCVLRGGGVTPAFAGHWEVVDNPYATELGEYDWEGEGTYQQYQDENALRIQGTVSTSYVYDSVPYNYTYNWQDQIEVMQDGNGFPGPGANMVFTDPGTNGTVISTGKRKIWYHWVKDNPNDNPPPILRLQIHSMAGAVLERIEDYINVELETSVGDGSMSEFPGSSTQNSNQYLSLADKTFPLTITTNGNDTVSTPWLTFSGSVKGDRISFYPDSSDYGDISFWLDYQLDDRAVEITSSAEPTYHKGTNGAPEQNPPGTADVAATWLDTLNMWYWNGAFDADLSGSPWDLPTYTWAGSLLQYNQSNPNPGNVSSISSAQYILPSYTEAAGPGGPYSLAVSAEDTDGRYIVGTYNVNFHNTHENDHEYKTQDEAPGVFIDDNPVIESITANPPYAIHNGSVDLNWTNTPYAETLNTAEVKIAGDTVAILATGFAPVEVIAGAAGVAQTALSQLNSQQSVNYNDCWYDNDPVTGNPTATWNFSSTRPDDTHLSEYKMIPHIHAGHKLHFIKYDGYDAHGYVGEQKIAVETLRSEAFYGEFLPLNQ